MAQKHKTVDTVFMINFGLYRDNKVAGARSLWGAIKVSLLLDTYTLTEEIHVSIVYTIWPNQQRGNSCNCLWKNVWEMRIVLKLSAHYFSKKPVHYKVARRLKRCPLAEETTCYCICVMALLHVLDVYVTLLLDAAYRSCRPFHTKTYYSG